MKCDKCKFHKGVRNPCVGGHGPKDLYGEGVLIVGEAPGVEEDKMGRPFVGPTGSLLRKFVEQIIPDVPVRYTNAVRCFPGKNKVADAVPKCIGHLQKEIRKVNPGRVIAFGSVAAMATSGYRIPITQVVEGWFRRSDIIDVTTQFAIHPSAQLHNGALRPFWAKTTARILKVPPPKKWKYHRDCRVVQVHSVKKALKVLTKALEQKLVALDTEYNDKTNRVLCMSLCWSPNKAYVLDDQVLKSPKVRRALEELFQNPNVRIAAHNWKYDAWVCVNGLYVDIDTIRHPDRWWVDTSTLRKLYHPEQDSNLEISEWMVGMGGGKEDLYSRLRGRTGPSYEKLYDEDPDLVMIYCGNDAIGCYRLALHYGKALQREGFWPLWNDLFGPLGAPLFQMEHNGVKIDLEAMDALDARLQRSLDVELGAIRSSKAVKRLCKKWGADTDAKLEEWEEENKGKKAKDRTKKPGKAPRADEFNPKSTLQMRALLFGPYGLKVDPFGKKTPAGQYKTDKYTLQARRNDHPIIVHIAEFNRLKHKHDTYVKGYRKRLDPENLLHTTYRQDVARTQRLSSRDPNLQNIPNRGWEEDRAIRRMFVPYDEETEVLAEFDYCLALGTGILTTGLDWVPIEKLEVGKEIIGFDEGLGRTTKFRASVVESKKTRYLPSFVVTTDRGVMVASQEHGWVCTPKKGRQTRRWVKTKDLKPGDKLAYLCDPWTKDTSWEGGYIAGFLDGEGWVTGPTVCYGQLPGKVLDYVNTLVKSRGFDISSSPNASGVDRVVLCGDRAGIRFLGTFKPKRLMEKSCSMWEGRSTWGRHSRPAIVESVEFIGHTEVVAIRTSTRTLIAEGFLTHNSQMELRIAADLSNDPVMMECFTQGIDIHSRTAANVLNKNPEEVTKEERTAAKPINFGAIFNMSDKGLQDNAYKQYGVTLSDSEAHQWLRGFFKLYRGYYKFMISEIARSKKRGCAYVYWKGEPFSRRWLFNLGLRGRESGGERSHAERQAINTPIQGGASLYTLRSLIILNWMWYAGKLPGVTAIIHTIHDSIILVIKKGWVKRTFSRVARVMVSLPTIRVPLEVEMKVGPNLADMKVIGVMNTMDLEGSFKVAIRRR